MVRMEFKERFKEKRIIVKSGADLFLPFAIVLGFYVILFGTVSPGGGFQGGVIVASAVLLIYLGYGYKRLVKAINPEYMRIGEALGAIVYVLLGLAGVFVGANFCRNFVFNNGEVGDMISAGNISFMSYTVGFKVLTGIGFLLILMLGILKPDKDAEDLEWMKAAVEDGSYEAPAASAATATATAAQSAATAAAVSASATAAAAAPAATVSGTAQAAVPAASAPAATSAPAPAGDGKEETK